MRNPGAPRIETFISSEQIAQRVAQLGRQISDDARGQPLVVVGILKGAFVFLADLVRRIDVPLSIEFMGVSSYVGTQSTGHVQITRDLAADIQGAHVLLVEDIVDTGKTMDFLLDLLRVRQPASIRLCTLLSKPEAHCMRSKIDYVGFEIGDEFVVGYGLDLDGRFRELPYVGRITGNDPSP